MEATEKHHIVSYKTFVIIWVCLIIFTVITVYVSHLHLGVFSVAVALLVASTKATLVAVYFMHLKFDNKILALFSILVMVIFTTFIVLTFFDYFYR